MTDWVELRRYDDNLEAEIALNFLRDHGVPVKLHGNSGQTSVLNRFTTIVDIRLMVPKKSIKRARRTLDAMTEAEVERVPEAEDEHAPGHPYRGKHRRKDEPSPRYRRAALVLSFLLPIGSGHIYSRHDVTGGVIAVGMFSFVVLAVLGRMGWPLAGCFFLALFDAIGSMRAVREHNEGAIPDRTTQFWRGVGFVSLALAIAFVARILA